MPDDATVSVRYLVDDVAAAVDFYTAPPRLHRADVVGAGVRRRPARQPAAAVERAGRARPARPMADGAKPGPGGWNRIHFIVDDLESEIARLQAEGVPFRNEVVTGPGGAQVLICDPSGNLVELFQPASR